MLHLAGHTLQCFGNMPDNGKDSTASPAKYTRRISLLRNRDAFPMLSRLVLQHPRGLSRSAVTTPRISIPPNVNAPRRVEPLGIHWNRFPCRKNGPNWTENGSGWATHAHALLIPLETPPASRTLVFQTGTRQAPPFGAGEVTSGSSGAGGMQFFERWVSTDPLETSLPCRRLSTLDDSTLATGNGDGFGIACTRPADCPAVRLDPGPALLGAWSGLLPGSVL